MLQIRSYTQATFSNQTMLDGELFPPTSLVKHFLCCQANFGFCIFLFSNNHYALFYKQKSRLASFQNFGIRFTSLTTRNTAWILVIIV